MKAIAKMAGGGFFLLESFYCVLAFVPYTYHFLINSPPYPWIAGMARYHVVLFWVACALLAYGYRGSIAPKTWWMVVAMQFALGAAAMWTNLLPALKNDWSAYAWSLLLPLPTLIAALADVKRYRPAHQEHAGAHLAYSRALLVAVIVPLLCTAAADLRSWNEGAAMPLFGREATTVFWIVLSHVWLAVMVISALNLIHSALDRHATHPATLRLQLVTGLMWVAITVALARFSGSSLTFDGWPAWAYCAVFGATLTCLAASVLLPFLRSDLEGAPRAGANVFPAALAAVLLLAGLITPAVVGEGDWNAILSGSVTLAMWIGLGVCVYLVRPRPKTYSVAAIVAVLLVTGTMFYGLKSSAVMWAKDIAPTDDDFEHNLEKLSSRNASYAMVHALLEEKLAQPCGEMCRTMRQYTNIRNAELRLELPLVDELKPATGARPNIFLIVVDSVRPDYVGAYNRRVDFTPNLDAFAKDSVIFKNAYSEYAGTTLSEAAIWTGIAMLHAHYVQPFERVNNLEKLANVDGYQMVLSWDTILRRILKESDEVVKLDADKQWTAVEFSDTVAQYERFLAVRRDPRPMLFYTQPTNVQLLAFNHLPRRTSGNWRERAGFNNRIAYELNQFDQFWGKFVALLKQRGLYDDSIIIVTSDHGEATGELGRIAHSTLIYPEVMRVPLIVKLPKAMSGLVYDENAMVALTDIAPTLYYLLGHRPIRKNELYGRPMFTETREELESYRRQELLLASDIRAAWGLLSDGGRYMYATYDEPEQSYLFDLDHDPQGIHNIVNDDLRRRYNRRLVEYLQKVADLYGYKATGGK